MKVTMFGGGGFIGSAVADRLLREGHSLRIFERPRVPPYRTFGQGEEVEWVTGDMLSTRDVSDALRGADAIIHLVSTTLPKSSNDDPIYDVQSNVVASLHLLDAMRAQQIGRIIFISSGGTVYGAPQYLPVDERHPTEPEVSYGITKLAIEKYLLMYGRLYGIRPVILRVANPFGARQRVETEQGAVAAFLYRAMRNVPIDIWGDGSVTRDFIYISDVADAFAKAVDYVGDQVVFNISSGVGTSLNDLVGLLEEVLGAPVARRYLNGRSFDVPVNILANNLARRELAWEPRVAMREGLARTIAWLGENPTP